VKCWGADYGGQVSKAPATIMANPTIIPAQQSALTQSAPETNSNYVATPTETTTGDEDSALKMGTSLTFTSAMLMMIYA